LAQEKEATTEMALREKPSINELRHIIEQRKGRSEYDCLLMFSGGKDSSYALYLLAKEFKLRVLAVTVDNWFHSPQVELNIKECVKRAGVDHITVRYDWNLWKRLYTIFLKRSGLHPRAICWPCNMLQERATYETLQKYNIPLWVTGNHMAELRLFRSWEKLPLCGLKVRSTRNKSFDHWNYWHRAYRTLMEHLLDRRDRDIIEQCIPPAPMLNDPAVKAHFMPILCYYPYNIEAQLTIIKNKLGWKLPSDIGGTETDCAGLQFCVALFKKIHGELAYDVEISRMVRSGTVSREIALRAVVNKDRTIVDRLFNELGLSWSDLRPGGCNDEFLREWLELLLPIR
jgi:hypothetical protein